MFPSMVFVCRAAHSRIVCTAHLHFRGNFRGIYECGGRNLGGRGARPSAGLHRVICVACGYMSMVTSLLAVQQTLSSRSPYGLGDDDEAVGICGFGDMICQHGCRAMRSPNCPPIRPYLRDQCSESLFFIVRQMVRVGAMEISTQIKVEKGKLKSERSMLCNNVDRRSSSKIFPSR